MTSKRIKPVILTKVQEWTLPAGATLGSSVRCKGILLEIRARLPQHLKKLLDIKGSVLVLSVREGHHDDVGAVPAIVTETLAGIETLPVIPREIEDILSIKTTERHRWLKDGRLQSAGTRTVKLYGRAKKITFHVFDPRHVEDVLDRDLVSAWREDDAQTARQNRQDAVWKAKLLRAQKSADPSSGGTRTTIKDDGEAKLVGWDEFLRNGPLR